MALLKSGKHTRLVFVLGIVQLGVLVNSTGSAMEHAGHMPGVHVVVGTETAEFNTVPVPAKHHMIPFMNVPGWRSNRVGFLVNCSSVKFDQIDPIVFPGVAQSAHMHEFFGNANINPNTTTQNLIDTPTTQIACTDTNDKSAYWSPAVYQNGRRGKANKFKAYYKSQTADTHPLPLGLRMVAGNAMANQNQSSNVGWWQTGAADSKSDLSATTVNQSHMISRAKGSHITLRINYPNCWDGAHLDSPDHMSHMTYAKGNTCPSTHIKVPQLITFTTYDISGGAGLSLSSGEWFTFHQDFWNGWDPDQLAELNTRCILHDTNHSPTSP